MNLTPRTIAMRVMPLLFLAGIAGHAGAVSITRNFSATWYDPAHSGQGFDLEVIDNPSGKNLLLYWYTYDANGAPMWVLAQGKASDDHATLSAVTTSGGRFGNTPSQVQVHAWGTVSIRFDDCNHGTVQWTPLDSSLAPGSMPITRLTQLFGSTCSGGISDDSGAAASGTGIGSEMFLANTGQVPQARAHARFEQFSDHASFEVELEDLPGGTYALRVDGAVQSTIDVASTPAGTQGEVEFRSPVEPGKLLLDFDPRGKAVEVLQGATIFFSSTLGSGGSTPPPMTGTPPPTGSAAYVLRVEPQGNDGPELYAELVQRADRVEFKVELEDVATGLYTIRVGGLARGELQVVALPGGTHGEIEFRNPAESGKEVLDFDPRGASIEAVHGGAVALAGILPAQPTGQPPNSEDNGSDDSGGGAGDDGGGGGPSDVQLSAELHSSGVDANANGFASYSQTANEREFEVQIEDVADGPYTLSVGGVSRGTIAVEGERGELRFNDPQRSGRPLLDFDPRGKHLEVSRAGAVYLSADFPN